MTRGKIEVPHQPLIYAHLRSSGAGASDLWDLRLNAPEHFCTSPLHVLENFHSFRSSAITQTVNLWRRR